MYEYKVVPAPKRGLKSRGVRGTEARFANALEKIMNDHAQSGWEYQRADTLPAEEREGLMGRATVYQNLLVFRRTIVEDLQVETPAAAVVAEAEKEKAPLVKDETTPVEEPATKPEPVKKPEVQTQEEIAKVDAVEPTDTSPKIDLADFKSERV